MMLNRVILSCKKLFWSLFGHYLEKNL